MPVPGRNAEKEVLSPGGTSQTSPAPHPNAYHASQSMPELFLLARFLRFFGFLLFASGIFRCRFLCARIFGILCRLFRFRRGLIVFRCIATGLFSAVICYVPA